MTGLERPGAKKSASYTGSPRGKVGKGCTFSSRPPPNRTLKPKTAGSKRFSLPRHVGLRLNKKGLGNSAGQMVALLDVHGNGPRERGGSKPPASLARPA